MKLTETNNAVWTPRPKTDDRTWRPLQQTIDEAITAMERIIAENKQGAEEKIRDEIRLEIIRMFRRK